MAVTPLRSFVVGQSNDLSCTRNNIRCLHWRLSSSVNTHRIVSNRLLLSNWVKARSPIDVLWPVTCAAQSCLTRCLAHGKCDTEMLTVLSILLCMQNRPPCLWAVNLKSPVTRLSVSQIHFNQFSHHFGITHILVVNYAVKNRDFVAFWILMIWRRLALAEDPLSWCIMKKCGGGGDRGNIIILYWINRKVTKTNQFTSFRRSRIKSRLKLVIHVVRWAELSNQKHIFFKFLLWINDLSFMIIITSTYPKNNHFYARWIISLVSLQFCCFSVCRRNLIILPWRSDPGQVLVVLLLSDGKI